MNVSTGSRCYYCVLCSDDIFSVAVIAGIAGGAVVVIAIIVVVVVVIFRRRRRSHLSRSHIILLSFSLSRIQNVSLQYTTRYNVIMHVLVSNVGSKS